MKRLIIFFINISLIQCQFLEAQSIKRSTICSVAITKTTTETRIASTMGQECIGCTVLEASNGFVRQGFQQPPDIEVLPECMFGSGIAVEQIDNDCGTYFNFEYTGTAPGEAEFLWDFGVFGVPLTSTEQNPMDITFSTPVNALVSLDIIVPDICQESVSVSVNSPSVGFAVQSNTTGTLCFGDTDGTISLEYFNGAAPFNISWVHSNDTSDILTNLEAGTYSYTVTDESACEIIGEAIIEGPLTDIVVEAAALSPESCSDTNDGRIELNVIGGTEPFSAVWSNQATGLTVTDLEKGIYSVEITDANGCQASGSFEILNYCEDADDILYDVFSPNGDGMNDVWIIPGIENFPNNKVVIHNRWGNIVWEINGYMNVAGSAFEGKSSDGKDLPTGAYYYVLEMNDQHSILLGGAITLVR